MWKSLVHDSNTLDSRAFNGLFKIYFDESHTGTKLTYINRMQNIIQQQKLIQTECQSTCVIKTKLLIKLLDKFTL